MKHRLINKISCLLVVSLLLFGTIPCQAYIFTPPKRIVSMAELLEWYGGLSGKALQECGVTKPIVSTGEVVLGATSCRVDITVLASLRVLAGARLTIDNPNLALSGPPSAITVEPGGVLHIRRLHMLTLQAMPQGSIVVQAGGTLVTDAGIVLPDGMVTDHNPPPNNPTPPTPEIPDETLPPTMPPPEIPDGTPPPTTPPADETLSVKGEVLKVSAGVLLAMVTLPCVDPALTETVVIERSADAQAWNTEYIFRWNENFLSYSTDETTEFGIICSRNRYDGSKTDFKYLARLSGEPFYLRVILTGTDGQQTVSNAIQMTEPPIGIYPGSDDYEDSDGNRGGGGQGTTDREEQKETAAPKPDSDLTDEPPITPQASAGTAGAEAPAVATPLAAQNKREQQTATGTQETVLPTQTSPPEQSGQAVLGQGKPADSSVLNWLVIAATLALCGAIWIFTTKRKKS